MADMEDIERIGVKQAHGKAHQALLVCAYENEAKHRMFNLDGSECHSKHLRAGIYQPDNVAMHRCGMECEGGPCFQGCRRPERHRG